MSGGRRSPPRPRRSLPGGSRCCRPSDLRAVDTSPLATTKVKGDKRQATLRVDVSEDDLTASTLFVVRARGLDAGGNDLELDDGAAGDAESDQFEV